MDPAVSRLEAHQKRLSALIATAHMLLQSAQYLSWFTRRVVDFNEQLPEFDRVRDLGIFKLFNVIFNNLY